MFKKETFFSETKSLQVYYRNIGLYNCATSKFLNNEDSIIDEVASDEEIPWNELWPAIDDLV